MNNFSLLTKVALLVLACIAQPAAAQTLLRVATPGGRTGLRHDPAVQVFRSIDDSRAQGGDPLAKNEVMTELAQK